jgi:hypothetical protein
LGMAETVTASLVLLAEDNDARWVTRYAGAGGVLFGAEGV